MLSLSTRPMKKKELLWNRNFVIACIANFLTACSFNLLMPTIPLYLSQELHIEHSKVGIILSSYALALLIVRPFSGFLVDTYPRKKVYLLGICCFMLTFIGYYFALTVAFFVVLRFVHGLFWGLSSVSANTVAIDIIPSSRRAEGIGFFGVNMNIAMATAPFFAIFIYEGYGFSYLITTAISMGVLAIVAISFIKVPVKNTISTPVLPQETVVSEHAATTKPKKAALSLDRFILVKALPILLNQLFITFGWGTLAAYAILYGQEISVSNPAFFYLFLALGIIASRITSGKLVDRGHIHKVIIFAISVVSVAFFCFSYFHNPIAYYISALFIGVGYGTLLPALQTIYINMAPASKRGTANSTYLTGFDIGVGLGMLTGASIAEFHSFESMYSLTAGLCAVGLILYVFMSRKIFDKHRLR